MLKDRGYTEKNLNNICFFELRNRISIYIFILAKQSCNYYICKMFRQVICCCQLRVTHFRYICTIIPKPNTMNTWIRFSRVNTLNWATCQKGLIIVPRTRDHLRTSCCWSLLQKSSIEHSRWAYASLSWCCYYKIVLHTKTPIHPVFLQGVN